MGSQFPVGEAGSDQIVAKGDNDFVYGGIGNDRCLSTKDGVSGDRIDVGGGTDHYIKDAFDSAVERRGDGVFPPEGAPRPVIPNARRQAGIATTFVWRYSSNPSRPFSRPTPDCL
jgi:RTX calcium-binding nonapeptide repeat (4 copies)